MLRTWPRALIAIAFVLASALAHDTPVQLPAPESAGEAWNVIEQSKANIDRLVEANLMRDVGAQLVNVTAALRGLDAMASNERDAERVHRMTSTLAAGETELLRDSRDTADAQASFRRSWNAWCKQLGELEALHPAEIVKAEVYICPMHPADRHLKADDKCTVCGMSLVRRRLPASAVYQAPGKATFQPTVKCKPLVVGQPAEVIMHLSRADGTPVRFDDLLEVHTKKIHLLINDWSLSDYHHEHPQPTETPGEYRFSFTPLRPGPYRIWADVVPAASGIQEYDIADLPADTAPTPIADRETRLSTTVGGRRFELAFDASDPAIRAGQTVIGTITVTEADGKLCTTLQPLMGAFAHLVGFSEDGKSVLHIHPYGKEPSSADDRAGPAFAFKFYAPAAGFLRLYCQVHIGGEDVFAPFNLNIQPAR